MVHYRPFAVPGTAPLTPPCCPAIVVAVHSTGIDPVWLSPAERDLLPGVLVTLCVFTVDGPQMHDAEQDRGTEAGGTWHWARDHRAGPEPTGG